jgi:predicted flavoprotein YhiN
MAGKEVVVIGAGAAGMMAAGRAAEGGARVILLEKTIEPGQKILVSGKTRCNLSNTAGLDEFLAEFGPNGRFLYGAFNRFFREDLLDFFRIRGVETQVERGGRIFPSSSDARDVVAALRRYLVSQEVRLVTGTAVTGIETRQGCAIAVKAGEARFPAAAVVLAAGGSSWPATGSTGDGYRLARSLGHTLVELRPALVPLLVEEKELAASMQGVSLRNVRLTAWRGRPAEISALESPRRDYGRGTGHERAPAPVIESRLGEMMMTHFGLGGPITLQMSLAVVDALRDGPVCATIDFKPGLSNQQLHLRLIRDFAEHGRQGMRRLLGGLLPSKLIEPFLSLSGIPGERPGSMVTAGEREGLVRLLKGLPFTITGSLPLASAMVTAGGVSLKEVDPRTMASKIIAGLFLCGEVLDLDANTGGFNLQAAFSTGWVAGEEAAICARRTI